MNIFFTSTDSRACAEALDDKRLNKMILETAQLLSSAALYRLGLLNEKGKLQKPDSFSSDLLTQDEIDTLYLPTHFNHPSCKFARASQTSYNWLFDHFCDLAKTKRRRDKYRYSLSNTNKPVTTHLSYTKLATILAKLVDLSARSRITADDILPYLVVDDDLRDYECPFAAYQKHMLRKWISDDKPTWTLNKPPKWAISYLPHAVSL